jgi:alpha-galactosidase/6-phospho-beta-glucosidase family protein
MSKKKIVIVGGGSYNWTPVLVKDLLQTKEFAGSIITLQDIDPAALDDIYRYCRKMVRDFGVDFRIEKTLNQKEALTGADFVIVTISTGGFETMANDLDIPAKYGIYQTVGDTIGPGGISRALRSIPVFVKMAKLMERCCPDAWMINYTNPMTAITRAVTKETSIKTVGLCHELFPVLEMLGAIFNVKKWLKDIPVTLAGVNHISWILDFKIDGEEKLPELIAKAKKGITLDKKARLKLSNETHKLDKNQVKFELLKRFGAFPAVGDRHLVEFFPYFLTEKSDAGKAYNVELTTIETRRDVWLADAKKKVHDYIKGKDKLIKGWSCETVSKIMACLATDKTIVDVVNVPNQGQIPELPLDTVVETMAVIGQNDVRPIAVGRLPRPILSLLKRFVAINELVVEAGLEGDKSKVLQALLLDPLTQDFNDAEKMMNELLKANKKYLPQFFPGRKSKRGK